MNNDTSKKCILTPTFSGHFQYLKNYLNSFRKNVTDKDRCVIYFIINSDEDKALQKIVKKYPDLDIRILLFEDILQKFGIALSPAFLLEKYGKFSFQALKKFYGMLYLEDYKHFLVLDSESMWINKTNMESMFKQFFSNPFILYSNVKERLSSSEANLRASENINFVLNSKCDKWFVEQFMRFWDVDILKSIFNEYGSCIEIVEKIYEFEKQKAPKMGLFESVLYDQYIYEHINSYKKYDMDKELSENMTDDVRTKYITDFYNLFNGSCGVTEHFDILLNKENIDSFVALFKKLCINILRNEDPDFKNIKNEISFLEKMKPNILTCSQSHCYAGKKTLIKICLDKPLKKLDKWLKVFFHPFVKTIEWISSPIKIIKYLMVMCVKFLQVMLFLGR